MLSVVIPVYNEQESLKVFYLELIKFIPKLSKNYEIIFVDDGSLDNSIKLLSQFKRKNKNVKLIGSRKHQGKAEALTLGFKAAKGSYIVTLDADLQDRPEEVEKLLEKAKSGWDLVSGVEKG